MPLIGAEAAAAAAATFFAAAIAFAYLSDSIGLRIAPSFVLAAAAAAAIVVFVRLRRSADPDRPAAAIANAVIVATFLWLLWLARPELLPTGSGPDLVHHLALIGYIEQHWRLVHDVRLSEYLGEMIDYTPGLHLLAALVGVWLRSDGLHVLYGVVAATVALKAVFVFLIARRLMPAGAPRDPFAAAAVLLLLGPYGYSVASFTEQSYLAQVVSELFAIAMWWALVVWDEQPSRGAAVLFGAFGVGAFLTWPVWTGPLLLLLAALALLHTERPLSHRALDVAAAALPVAAIAVLHGWQHPGGFRMAGTGGFVIAPTPAQVGPGFYGLAAIGVVAAALQRRMRALTLLLVAIAAQAAVLTATARASGAANPYLALKMFYLAIYPMAIAIAVAAAALWRLAMMRAPRLRPAAAWALVLLTTILVARPLAVRPRPKPVVTERVLRAGEWARAHVPPACVDYLTQDGYTAYWLHLAVFGQPRASGRATDDDTFEPKKALVRWILPGGLPYAVADDLDALPRDIRSNVDIVAQFGRAAVVRRRGTPGPCP
jgi:hypothetical protein